MSALGDIRAKGAFREPQFVNLGGGPIPAEVSAQLKSLKIEYSRGKQPFDRLYGLDRLVGIFTYHGRVPVMVIEDTEAALGPGVDDEARDRFFTSSLKLLVREVETPTIIAQLRPHLFEANIPNLAAKTEDGLRKILAHRLAFFGIGVPLDDLIVAEALPALAALYDETHGSIRHVFAALEVAAAAAIDNDAIRLVMGHVRLGVEDWRDR